MKLLHYTYRKLSLLLLLLMAAWGVLFYYAIIDEVMDETDDTLENYSEILINNALMDPSVLETEGTLMSFYKFRPISEEEAEDYDEKYYDSTVYIESEDEDEPVRVLKTVFRMPDGQYYELELMISILESGSTVFTFSDLYVYRYTPDIAKCVPPAAAPAGLVTTNSTGERASGAG